MIKKITRCLGNLNYLAGFLSQKQCGSRGPKRWHGKEHSDWTADVCQKRKGHFGKCKGVGGIEWQVQRLR